MDVIVALDSSNDVTDGDFTKQKNFLATLINGFTVAANKTRLGVILYSDQPSEVIGLPQYSDITSLRDGIVGLTRIRGSGGNNRVNSMMQMAKSSLRSSKVDNYLKVKIKRRKCVILYAKCPSLTFNCTSRVLK